MDLAELVPAQHRESFEALRQGFSQPQDVLDWLGERAWLIHPGLAAVAQSVTLERNEHFFEMPYQNAGQVCAFDITATYTLRERTSPLGSWITVVDDQSTIGVDFRIHLEAQHWPTLPAAALFDASRSMPRQSRDEPVFTPAKGSLLEMLTRLGKITDDHSIRDVQAILAANFPDLPYERYADLVLRDCLPDDARAFIACMREGRWREMV